VSSWQHLDLLVVKDNSPYSTGDVSLGLVKGLSNVPALQRLLGDGIGIAAAMLSSYGFSDQRTCSRRRAI